MVKVKAKDRGPKESKSFAYMMIANCVLLTVLLLSLMDVFVPNVNYFLQLFPKTAMKKLYSEIVPHVCSTNFIFPAKGRIGASYSSN